MAISHDHLDKLLKTARAGQLDEFKRLVQETMCINEIHPINHEEIVVTLANEGLTHIVRYLIEQGACPHRACGGAARGGHDALVKELLDLGVTPYYAVKGAAVGGHTKLMWTLIHSDADREAALRGAGVNGDPTLIDSLIQDDKDRIQVLFGAIESGNRDRIRSWMSSSQHPQLISELLRIAARTGDLSLIDELKAHYGEPITDYKVFYTLALHGHEAAFMERYEQQSENIAWGIYGAAGGGHVDFMNRLIEIAIQLALLDEKTALRWAVQGAGEAMGPKLVDHLIERGATIEDALLSASRSQQTPLVNTLIARGTASGQLRKNVAIRAAAMANRDDLVMEWLAQGASSNEALRGVCFRGTNIEMARYLIKQGASAKWILVGIHEAELIGRFMPNSEGFIALSKDTTSADSNFFTIQGMTQSGHVTFFQQFLDRYKNKPNRMKKQKPRVLNEAIVGAAAGGFRTLVSSLLSKGASRVAAILGAVLADDRYLIESLIPANDAPSQSLQGFFKTAFAMRRDDLVQWMLQRLGPSGIDQCAEVIKTGKTPNSVIQALSMIRNSDQQLEIAGKAQAVVHMRPAQIMSTAKVSPHIAVASTKFKRGSLRYFFNVCFLNKPRMPKDLVIKLISCVAASEGHPISEREVPDLMRASDVAGRIPESIEDTPMDPTEMEVDVESSRGFGL